MSKGKKKNGRKVNINTQWNLHFQYLHVSDTGTYTLSQILWNNN